MNTDDTIKSEVPDNYSVLINRLNSVVVINDLTDRFYIFNHIDDLFNTEIENRWNRIFNYKIPSEQTAEEYFLSNEYKLISTSVALSDVVNDIKINAPEYVI